MRQDGRGDGGWREGCVAVRLMDGDRGGSRHTGVDAGFCGRPRLGGWGVRGRHTPHQNCWCIYIFLICCYAITQSLLRALCSRGWRPGACVVPCYFRPPLSASNCRRTPICHRLCLVSLPPPHSPCKPSHLSCSPQLPGKPPASMRHRGPKCRWSTANPPGRAWR